MQCIKSKKVYVGDGSTLSDVYVCWEGKTIKYVGKEEKGEVLGEFEVLTPAFIDAHSHMGMDRHGEPWFEGEANEELDSVIPYIDAIDSIYMDDEYFKESVEWGVLYSAVMPGSGNIIGGRVVAIRNWETHVDKAFIKYVGIKAALGYNPRSTTNWRGLRPNTRMGVIGLFKKYFDKARSEWIKLKEGKTTWDELDPITKALIPVIEGRLPLRVHVHKEDDIAILRKLAKIYGFKHTVDHACDVHTEEGFKMIKEMGVPLVYGPVDSFAYKTELKHESYKNIKLLIKYMPEVTALMSDHPVVLQRNLFLQLRFFMMYGMPFEEALKLITSNAAKVLGINAGEIKVGKLASVVAWSGEPYIMGNKVEMVIAEGKKVIP